MELITNILSDNFKIHQIYKKANQCDINYLQHLSPIKIPKDYLEIAPLDDIEINVKNELYLRLWSVKDVMDYSYPFHKYIPECLAVGDDEGEHALIYLDGNNGFGLYYISFGNICLEDAIYISPSLTDLFKDEVGIEIVINPYNN